MSALIPFLKRSTLNDWIYDVDRLFEPVLSNGDKHLSLSGDIEETDDHILMSFDIPGMKEGDFNIKIQDQKLILTGEKKKEIRSSDKDEKNGYVFYGREFGKFNKVFNLPKTVDKTKIEADYKDGVLHLLLPKVEPVEENVINVKVGPKGSLFEKLVSSKKA